MEKKGIGNNEFKDFAPDTVYFYMFPCGGINTCCRPGKEWIEAFKNTPRDAEKMVLSQKMIFVPEGDESEEGTIYVTESWLHEFWRRHNVI